MAGCAVGGIDFCAAVHLLCQGVDLTWIIGQGCHFFFLFLYPFGVVLIGYNTHYDWHKGMLGTAKLGTLTTIGANLFCFKPGIAHKSRDGVLLDSERLH